MMTARQVAPTAVASPRPGWWREPGTLLTGAVLLAVTAIAWIGVVRQAAAMGAMDGAVEVTGMEGMAATPGMGGPFSVPEALAFVSAWGVMMAAMMLPSALPMILLYRTVSRTMMRSGQQVVPTALFAATYLVVWVVIGVPVYLASAAVTYVARGSESAAAALPYALAVVLVVTGAYQFTAIKRVCLKQCQAPLSFLMQRWCSGYGGTLRVGLSHALYCVGCCWGLMAVLVAAGAMGLAWVLLIAVIVFAEKLLPRGEWTARGVGVALVILALAVVAHPHLTATLRGQTM